MSYQIETILPFNKAVKRLAKKYRRIKKDLVVLVKDLSTNPFIGVAITGFADEVWKVRMASRDMQAGKRGGYRVIYAINRETEKRYLMYIYAKSQKADISAQEIERLLAELEEYLVDQEESEKVDN